MSDIAIERDVVLAASPEKVWEHMTDGELVSRWMGGSVTLDLRVGGAIRMISPDAPDVWGSIEEVIEGRRLQWSWRTDDGLPTLVEIELEPEKTGTRLTVRESLLPWQSTLATPVWISRSMPRFWTSMVA
ncbi:MAG: SRPBCC domain-containing protein [Acidimicrobiia bacterium]